MAEPTVLMKLLEKWLDLYDRSLLYFYAFFSALAALLGKDLILGNKTPADVFGTGSVGSYYIVGTTLLFASFLTWYNYVSEVLFYGSFAHFQLRAGQ